MICLKAFNVLFVDVFVSLRRLGDGGVKGPDGVGSTCVNPGTKVCFLSSQQVNPEEPFQTACLFVCQPGRDWTVCLEIVPHLKPHC